MTEDFLHFVWKYKNFNTAALKTIDGQEVRILKAGEHNKHAGPDFLNAQIMVGDTQWAGHVELHMKTSDWNAHRHSSDPAYDNIIMHVVYDHDLPKPVPEGRPLLQLSPYLSPYSLKNYETLQQNTQIIPCQELLPDVSEFTRQGWLDRMLVERMEQKSKHISQLLAQNKNDWAETAYQVTGRNFGFKVNAEPFEKLTRSLAHKIIAKHKNSLHQVEALLYGQAGFLGDVLEDEYHAALRKECKFLAGKYNLTPLRKSEWKFLRMRPANFPTIRIAQFADLVVKSEHLFSKILEVKTLKDALKLFEVEAGEYWKNHFTFGEAAENKAARKLGKDSKYNLIINTVAPLLFSYGHIKEESRFKVTALELLEQCPKELNHITKSATSMGFENKHAYHSQALIYLRNDFCLKHRCLECGIGAAVLKAR